MPKAELHCHIEGAATPELVLAQAAKYGVDVSGTVDAHRGYVWEDFTSFLKAYDLAASLFRTPEDYIGLARDHFVRLAGQGCIYGEVFSSPDHAERMGCSYPAMTEAIAEGIDQARVETGIEGRIVVTGVRHVGIEAVEKAAMLAVRHPHPLVTGFGMAGDERVGHPSQFRRAFDIARDGGLGLTCHAGEFGGPQSVEAVLDHLAVSRIGHGVRAIEKPDLVRRLADEAIVLEVCPVSNVVLGVFASAQAHPFPALLAAGCRVTLNSDDPPHFHTSLEKEYAVARDAMGISRSQLLACTRTAIEAAFVDGETRRTLLEKCDAAAIE
ncbi:MAG: adenosine deaminase [Nitratireductor sp.]|nr:adenosine deaminase [Nitratireductor sp.]